MGFFEGLFCLTVGTGLAVFNESVARGWQRGFRWYLTPEGETRLRLLYVMLGLILACTGFAFRRQPPAILALVMGVGVVIFNRKIVASGQNTYRLLLRPGGEAWLRIACLFLGAVFAGAGLWSMVRLAITRH